MARYFGALTLVLLVGMVIVRVLILQSRGINAMNFGKTHKTDFFIPPFALFYFYLVFAAAFALPTVSRQVFFHSEAVAWIGLLFCLVGLLFMLWSLVSFGRSFRVGIDVEHPDQLVTTGAFSLSRNPIYVAFAFVLVGQFLTFPNWILLLYAFAGVWLFHRQILREEDYLSKHYSAEYEEYRRRVRRYL